MDPRLCLEAALSNENAFGIQRMIADLTVLGFSVVARSVSSHHFAIVESFEVATGRFAGRVIQLGLPAPSNYPHSVGSAIHVAVDPQLLDTCDTVPGVRNVIASPLGHEWRYWSFNFNWNPAEGRSTGRLIRQVHGIFDRI
jgi:hypothetical protein